VLEQDKRVVDGLVGVLELDITWVVQVHIGIIIAYIRICLVSL
jgi:hypothetical protein